MRRARANICCSSGDKGGSAALCVFHCCRSTTANISSSWSSSSSNANTCSAGRCILGELLKLAKSVQTSIKSLQFFFFLSSDHHPQILLQLWVRLTSHKLFTDKFLAKLWRALWITQPAQFCYGVRVCIGVFLMASCPAMKS